MGYYTYFTLKTGDSDVGQHKEAKKECYNYDISEHSRKS